MATKRVYGVLNFDRHTLKCSSTSKLKSSDLVSRESILDNFEYLSAYFAVYNYMDKIVT